SPLFARATSSSLVDSARSRTMIGMPSARARSNVIPQRYAGSQQSFGVTRARSVDAHSFVAIAWRAPAIRNPVTTPILMDVDTGIDDSLALLYLLASPEAEIVGITCTAGNVPARQVAINNLAWLELCKAPNIEVALGSEVPVLAPLMTTEETHGPQGIGYAVLPEPTRQLSKRHAVDVWADAARSRPGEVVGLVTGPLTNLALALRIEPELPRLLKRLVIMGGAFNHPGNTTPVSEWNIAV